MKKLYEAFEDIFEDILLEGTKYDKQAGDILTKSGLFDAETSKKIITALFKKHDLDCNEVGNGAEGLDPEIHAFVRCPN